MNKSNELVIQYILPRIGKLQYSKSLWRLEIFKQYLVLSNINKYILTTTKLSFRFDKHFVLETSIFAITLTVCLSVRLSNLLGTWCQSVLTTHYSFQELTSTFQLTNTKIISVSFQIQIISVSFQIQPGFNCECCPVSEVLIWR